MNQKPFFQDMNSKIVDSHCHLDFKDFDDDRDEVIKNAKLNNVDFLLSISVNLENFNNVHKIAKNNKNIWCTTGIHPNNVEKDLSSIKLEEIQSSLILNLENEKVVGVGETGLDFFKNNLNKKNQIESFNVHLQVSGEKKFPTIVHMREAEEDTDFCITQAVKKYDTKGLIHCFTSTKKFAKLALDNGFYISFSGIITFKNVSDLIDVVKYVPLDRILVETDSPYLAPVPKRGKRNEPSYVNYTLEKIADIKNKSLDDIAKVTTSNFFSLFSTL